MNISTSSDHTGKDPEFRAVLRRRLDLFSSLLNNLPESSPPSNPQAISPDGLIPQDPIPRSPAPAGSLLSGAAIALSVAAAIAGNAEMAGVSDNSCGNIS